MFVNKTKARKKTDSFLGKTFVLSPHAEEDGSQKSGGKSTASTAATKYSDSSKRLDPAWRYNKDEDDPKVSDDDFSEAAESCRSQKISDGTLDVVYSQFSYLDDDVEPAAVKDVNNCSSVGPPLPAEMNTNSNNSRHSRFNRNRRLSRSGERLSGLAVPFVARRKKRRKGRDPTPSLSPCYRRHRARPPQFSNTFLSSFIDDSYMHRDFYSNLDKNNASVGSLPRRRSSSLKHRYPRRRSSTRSRNREPMKMIRSRSSRQLVRKKRWKSSSSQSERSFPFEKRKVERIRCSSSSVSDVFDIHVFDQRKPSKKCKSKTHKASCLKRNKAKTIYPKSKSKKGSYLSLKSLPDSACSCSSDAKTVLQESVNGKFISVNTEDENAIKKLRLEFQMKALQDLKLEEQLVKKRLQKYKQILKDMGDTEPNSQYERLVLEPKARHDSLYVTDVKDVGCSEVKLLRSSKEAECVEQLTSDVQATPVSVACPSSKVKVNANTNAMAAREFRGRRNVGAINLYPLSGPFDTVYHTSGHPGVVLRYAFKDNIPSCGLDASTSINLCETKAFLNPAEAGAKAETRPEPGVIKSKKMYLPKDLMKSWGFEDSSNNPNDSVGSRKSVKKAVKSFPPDVMNGGRGWQKNIEPQTDGGSQQARVTHSFPEANPHWSNNDATSKDSVQVINSESNAAANEGALKLTSLEAQTFDCVKSQSEDAAQVDSKENAQLKLGTSVVIKNMQFSTSDMSNKGSNRLNLLKLKELMIATEKREIGTQYQPPSDCDDEKLEEVGTRNSSNIDTQGTKTTHSTSTTKSRVQNTSQREVDEYFAGLNSSGPKATSFLEKAKSLLSSSKKKSTCSGSEIKKDSSVIKEEKQEKPLVTTYGMSEESTGKIADNIHSESNICLRSSESDVPKPNIHGKMNKIVNFQENLPKLHKKESSASDTTFVKVPTSSIREACKSEQGVLDTTQNCSVLPNTGKTCVCGLEDDDSVKNQLLAAVLRFIRKQTPISSGDTSPASITDAGDSQQQKNDAQLADSPSSESNLTSAKISSDAIVHILSKMTKDMMEDDAKIQNLTTNSCNKFSEHRNVDQLQKQAEDILKMLRECNEEELDSSEASETALFPKQKSTNANDGKAGADEESSKSCTSSGFTHLHANVLLPGVEKLMQLLEESGKLLNDV